MKYTISSDKQTLTIFLDAGEHNNLPDDETEALESMLGNCELDWCSSDITGDLTGAPMLAIYGSDERGDAPPCSGYRHTGADERGSFRQPVLYRWAFMRYQIRTIVDDLRGRGFAVFAGGPLHAQIEQPQPIAV